MSAPFPSKQECPKCGACDLVVRHMTDHMLGDGKMEWMRWKCNKCDFLWTTDTKDTQVPTRTEK